MSDQPVTTAPEMSVTITLQATANGVLANDTRQVPLSMPTADYTSLQSDQENGTLWPYHNRSVQGLAGTVDNHHVC